MIRYQEDLSRGFEIFGNGVREEDRRMCTYSAQTSMQISRGAAGCAIGSAASIRLMDKPKTEKKSIPRQRTGTKIQKAAL